MKVSQMLKDFRKPPNILSSMRLVLTAIPVSLILAQPEDPIFRLWALAVTLVIAATDAVDGYVARRWNQTSELGEILDPLADKALVISLVIALCWTGILAAPWGWAFLVLNVVRELGVPAVRYLNLRGKSRLVIPADENGKRKMMLQAAGILLAIIPIFFWWWQIVIWVPLAASFVYSVRSGKAYLEAK